MRRTRGLVANSLRCAPARGCIFLGFGFSFICMQALLICAMQVSFTRGGWFTFLFTDVAGLHLHDVDIAAQRDGIDLVGARHVVAERIRIHSGGDDAFALKSDWSLGRQLDSWNITLRDSELASGIGGTGDRPAPYTHCT